MTVSELMGKVKDYPNATVCIGYEGICIQDVEVADADDMYILIEEKPFW